MTLSEFVSQCEIGEDHIKLPTGDTIKRPSSRSRERMLVKQKYIYHKSNGNITRYRQELMEATPLSE